MSERIDLTPSTDNNSNEVADITSNATARTLQRLDSKGTMFNDNNTSKNVIKVTDSASILKNMENTVTNVDKSNVPV